MTDRFPDALEGFVQVNLTSRKARSHPVGYIIKPGFNPCWLWCGEISRNGYGRMTDPSTGRKVAAHRYLYEKRHGSIPASMECDHLCRVRHCVNPDHIEAVTGRENILRGTGVTAIHARKPRCSICGSDYAPARQITPSRSVRRCLNCERQRKRRRYAANLDTSRARERDKYARRIAREERTP